MKSTLIGILLCLAVFTLVGADDNPTLNDLSFMTGKWIGEGFGGITEESWGSPLGGVMQATFRLTVQDTARVLEYIIVEDNGQDLIYRFKHYTRDFKPWEETPLTYFLKRVSDNRAEFAMKDPIPGKPFALIYERSNENMLVMILGAPDSAGVVDTLPLRFRLAK